MFHISIPLKTSEKKTKDFLTFSRDVETDKWRRMGYVFVLKLELGPEFIFKPRCNTCKDFMKVSNIC